jgi:GUN4-like/Caspase domain
MGNNAAANNWAIVVGVNDYDFLPDASLRFAVKDALAMKAFLCEEAGFPEKQVLLCGDGSSGTRKATRPILRDILRSEIQHAQNADNLWFFFSGHGLGEHLMPIDGNPHDLKDTAISIRFVTEQLRACKAKNIVLVLDMCRNEHHGVGQKSVVSVAASLKKLVQDREGQQGIITLFSCGRGESSYEIASLEQGAFTHALLEGLKQQTILKELETYLARRVPELHSESGKTRKQVPLVIPEPGWKYDEPILSHYATAIDVAQLKEMAIDAESDGETEKAIQLWEQVNLLAEKGADRQRAVNRIKHLLSKRSAVSYVVKTQSSLGTPIEFPVFEAQAKPLSITPEPQDQHPIDTIPIESEKKIDYRKLRDLLKEGKWEEADQETHNLMNQVIGTASIKVKHLKTYPLEAIEEIDQIWAEFSAGKFGFKIQAKIWQQCDRDERKFELEVGWRDEGRNRQKPYRKLILDPSTAKPGHLPAFFKSWGGGGWSWTAYLLDRVSEGISPSPVDDVPLESEKGVDYRKLRDLLREGKWEEADRETYSLMLEVAGSEEKWFEYEDLENFSSTDLLTIDQLWVAASYGRFGFSVQKRIWQELGNPCHGSINYSSAHEEFGDRVGWRSKHGWLNYSDLEKDPKYSPIGEMPGLPGAWCFLSATFSKDIGETVIMFLLSHKDL